MKSSWEKENLNIDATKATSDEVSRLDYSLITDTVYLQLCWFVIVAQTLEKKKDTRVCGLMSPTRRDWSFLVMIRATSATVQVQFLLKEYVRDAASSISR